MKDLDRYEQKYKPVYHVTANINYLLKGVSENAKISY